MVAPVIEWVRDGVGFAPAAAASFRRMEAEIGRIPCNSTYRDWDKQYSMWRAWEAYVAGRGPWPGHSRAINPDLSQHCKGLAFDTSRVTDVLRVAAAHGWFRVPDPTEAHHFEYRAAFDTRKGAAVASTVSRPLDLAVEPLVEGDDMNVSLYQIIDGKAVTYALAGPGFWWEFSGTTANGPKVANRLAAKYNRTGPAATGAETAINLTYDEWRELKKACTA